MSERNSGLFLAGHQPAAAVGRVFAEVFGPASAELVGEEAPRLGHGTRNGRAYTHIGLRLFEVGGLLLFDSEGLPADDEPEMRLGAALSRLAGQAVYLRYDDESAVGGHARFEGGRLVSRAAIDGRESRPVLRDLSGQRVLEGVDASDWVWTPIGDAVEAGATPLVGPGLRSDDDIEALISGANATPIVIGAAGAPRPAPQAAPRPTPQAAPHTGGGLLGRLAKRVGERIKR